MAVEVRFKSSERGRRLLTITEVSHATGLQSSALRYYERVGLIEPAGRTGGRRHYSEDVLQRLAVIALLQEVGFTITEIAGLFARSERGHAWRELAQTKLGEIDAHLERVHTARELLQAALTCGCSNLERCDLIDQRRGRHRNATKTLTLRWGAP